MRGVVAAYLGYEYHGIDLRQEQIDANYQNANEIGVCPHWYCDDSINADNYINDDTMDMVFTCPPYADLEVYSDDPRDISSMSYDDFLNKYKAILQKAVKKLKNDRFAVVVIGDVRDKKGFYRLLPDTTKQIMQESGALFYNDCVLVEQVGTGALRADKTFNPMRKVIKTHQNVLVFYKGKPQNIKNNFSKIDYSEDDVCE